MVLLLSGELLDSLSRAVYTEGRIKQNTICPRVGGENEGRASWGKCIVIPPRQVPGAYERIFQGGSF